MFFKFILPVVLLSYSASAAHHNSLNLEPIVAQQRVALDIMISHLTRTQAAADSTGPNRITDVDVNKCFTSYTSQQDSVVTKYNTNYNGCLTTADAAKAALSQESSEQRKDMLERGNGVCTALSDCDNIDDGLQFFQCYNTASGENYPTLYKINTDSNSIIEKMKIQYQTIDNNLNICTTDAHNNYVSGMASCNTDLNNCLNGAPPATVEPTAGPTVTVPIDTTTIGTPTTEEDETTGVDTTVEDDLPTEASPEEDLWKYRPMSRMNMWNVLKRL